MLDGIKPVLGPNWSALEGHLTIRRGDGAPFALAPQSRFFSQPPTVTSESAIATMWDGQLYTVLGAAQGDGRWQLRLWWKPFVTLIWLGGALIALGGAAVAGRALVARGRGTQRNSRSVGMKRWLIWVPLAVFAALLAAGRERTAQARRPHRPLGDDRPAAARTSR